MNISEVELVSCVRTIGTWTTPSGLYRQGGSLELHCVRRCGCRTLVSSAHDRGQPELLTMQDVRSGTFLMVDMSMRFAWVQYMHLVVKYSVLRIGLPTLIQGHYDCTQR